MAGWCGEPAGGVPVGFHSEAPAALADRTRLRAERCPGPTCSPSATAPNLRSRHKEDALARLELVERTRRDGDAAGIALEGRRAARDRLRPSLRLATTSRRCT